MPCAHGKANPPDLQVPRVGLLHMASHPVGQADLPVADCCTRQGQPRDRQIAMWQHCAHGKANPVYRQVWRWQTAAHGKANPVTGRVALADCCTRSRPTLPDRQVCPGRLLHTARPTLCADSRSPPTCLICPGRLLHTARPTLPDRQVCPGRLLHTARPTLPDRQVWPGQTAAHGKANPADLPVADCCL